MFPKPSFISSSLLPVETQTEEDPVAERKVFIVGSTAVKHSVLYQPLYCRSVMLAEFLVNNKGLLF